MATLQSLAQDTFSVDRINDDGVPTASIAILEDGNISSHVLTKGPETTDTVYQAASISKAICSLAITKLVDDGKLSYEAKAVDHLAPELVDAMVDDKTRHLMQRVTLKMLVSHTSGLSQHGFPGYGDEKVTPQDIIAGRPPANTPRMRFLSWPGAQCCYSGGGFVILQFMLENILNMPFADIMHSTVLRPLNMTRSWYGTLPADEKNFARAHFSATSKSPTVNDRGYNILHEQAAAGLWTTPSDLLRAVLAIQDSLHSSEGAFLKQATAKRLLAKTAASGALGAYGLGWAVNSLSFGHGGDNWPGFQAFLLGFHGEAGDGRNGIAVMTNSMLGHHAAQRQIIAAVMHAQGWKGSNSSEDETWLACFRNKFVPYALPESVVVGEGWKAWKGEWEDGYSIVEEGGGPALVYGEFPAMRLRPAAAPVTLFEDGEKEMWCVVDGLDIGVRLTWDDEGKQVVKLQLEDEKVLKRRAE